MSDDGTLEAEYRLKDEQLGEFAEQCAGAEAALEASGHYRDVHDQLDAHLDVTGIHPSKNRLIAETSTTTDQKDAKQLAMLPEA